MIGSWMELVIKKLMINQDYLLLPDNQGKIQIQPMINTMIKENNSYMVYLQILEGNKLPLEGIQAQLDKESDVLRRIRNQKITYAYTIIVFEKMEEEKREMIRAWQEMHLTEMACYKCFIVDLEQERVYKLFSRATRDNGLKKSLEKILQHNKKNSYKQQEGRDEESVAEIVEKKKQEYHITFKVKMPWMTYGLIAINVFVFIVLKVIEYLTGIEYAYWLIYFGAKVNGLIEQGDYWRLVTPIFLHGNFMHLVVNCGSLYALGDLVERLYGHGKFLISYLIAGIIGNLMSFFFVPGYSVGASGAIFGLMGMLLYFGLEHPLQFRVYLGKAILSTLVINLVYGLSVSGIDNSAHLGGLVGGFLGIGALTNSKKDVWYCRKINYWIALGILLAWSVGFALYFQ